MSPTAGVVEVGTRRPQFGELGAGAAQIVVAKPVRTQIVECGELIGGHVVILHQSAMRLVPFSWANPHKRQRFPL